MPAPRATRAYRERVVHVGARLGGAARPFTAGAVALAVFGTLMLLLELEDPSTNVYWTGRPVQGVVDRGIIYYFVGGEQYTIDVAGRWGPASPEPTTVYVDPGDPSHALRDRALRWFDLLAVAVWPVASALLLVWGQLVRRKRARDRERLPSRLRAPLRGVSRAP